MYSALSYTVCSKKPAMHTLGSRPNLGKKFQNTLQRILIYTYIKTVTAENCTSPQTYRQSLIFIFTVSQEIEKQRSVMFKALCNF